MHLGPAHGCTTCDAVGQTHGYVHRFWRPSRGAWARAPGRRARENFGPKVWASSRTSKSHRLEDMPRGAASFALLVHEERGAQASLGEPWVERRLPRSRLELGGSIEMAAEEVVEEVALRRGWRFLGVAFRRVGAVGEMEARDGRVEEVGTGGNGAKGEREGGHREYAEGRLGAAEDDGGRSGAAEGERVVGASAADEEDGHGEGREGLGRQRKKGGFFRVLSHVSPFFFESHSFEGSRTRDLELALLSHSRGLIESHLSS